MSGVDTHKDLHVAAVVDQNNKVLGTQYFATTRQGYRQMLAWMTSFGALKRIGVECTGTYGSGLLRYLQNAGLEVLEVTAPDRMERRKRGKSDTIDAECADVCRSIPAPAPCSGTPGSSVAYSSRLSTW